MFLSVCVLGVHFLQRRGTQKVTTCCVCVFHDKVQSCSVCVGLKTIVIVSVFLQILHKCWPALSLCRSFELASHKKGYFKHLVDRI